MPDINGLSQVRASLTANVAQKVTFESAIYNIDLANMGQGNVAFSTKAAPSSPTDVASNYLSENVPVISYYNPKGFSELNFVSDSNTDIQWVVR